MGDIYTEFAVKSCIVIFIVIYFKDDQMQQGGMGSTCGMHGLLFVKKIGLNVLKDRNYVGGRLWTGFIWLRIGACSGFL
jgi:hypothetical protein